MIGIRQKSRDGDPRVAKALDELEQNTNVKVGAWQVARDDEDNHLAIFRATIAADLSGDLLKGVIVGVLVVADEVEERLSGRDDF